MALTAEQKQKITDAAVLDAIDDIEKELAARTFEAADRRTKLKKVEDEKKSLEGNYASVIEKMKKLGFNPDEDFEQQFPTIIEKVNKEKGLKPSAEFDNLMKKIEKLSGEVAEWKGAAERERKEAQVEKAATLFDPALGEAFGKSAHIVKELLRLKGNIVLKDGVAGIQNGEEFLPLNAEKGQVSAIDFIKKTYPDLVITKQKTGAGGAASGKNGGAGKDGMVSRAEFDLFSPAKKVEYMQKIGQLTDNISE